MEIEISDFVTDYFVHDKDFQQLKKFIYQRLPLYVASHSPKIKPIRNGVENYYECRVKVGLRDYRLGFYYHDQIIRADYLSTSLQKIKFDAEMKRFLTNANR